MGSAQAGPFLPISRRKLTKIAAFGSARVPGGSEFLLSCTNCSDEQKLQPLGLDHTFQLPARLWAVNCSFSTLTWFWSAFSSLMFSARKGLGTRAAGNFAWCLTWKQCLCSLFTFACSEFSNFSVNLIFPTDIMHERNLYKWQNQKPLDADYTSKNKSPVCVCGCWFSCWGKGRRSSGKDTWFLF